MYADIWATHGDWMADRGGVAVEEVFGLFATDGSLQGTAIQCRAQRSSGVSCHYSLIAMQLRS